MLGLLAETATIGHVDDFAAGIGSIKDALDGVGDAKVTDADRHEQGVPTRSGNADTIVGVSGGHPGRTGPVAVGVRRVTVQVHHVFARHELVFQVRVVQFRTGVEDAHDHLVRTLEQVPSRRDVDGAEPLLVHVERVVGRRVEFANEHRLGVAYVAFLI